MSGAAERRLVWLDGAAPGVVLPRKVPCSRAIVQSAASAHSAAVMIVAGIIAPWQQLQELRELQHRLRGGGVGVRLGVCVGVCVGVAD
jgi:hypothetical protein